MSYDQVATIDNQIYHHTASNPRSSHRDSMKEPLKTCKIQNSGTILLKCNLVSPQNGRSFSGQLEIFLLVTLSSMLDYKIYIFKSAPRYAQTCIFLLCLYFPGTLAIAFIASSASIQNLPRAGRSWRRSLKGLPRRWNNLRLR